MFLVKTSIKERRNELNTLSAIADSLMMVHHIAVLSEQTYKSYEEDGKTYVLSDHEVIVASDPLFTDGESTLLMQFIPVAGPIKPDILAALSFEDSIEPIMKFITAFHQEKEITPLEIIKRSSDETFVKEVEEIVRHVAHDRTLDEIPNQMIADTIIEVVSVRLLDPSSKLIHEKERISQKMKDIFAISKALDKEFNEEPSSAPSGEYLH